MNELIIIAEAGVNHNGNLDTALKLADAAKDAGADFIKFQSFRTESLLVKGTPKAAYQKVSDSVEDDQYRMIKRLEMSITDQMVVMNHCKTIGIGFLSSPFDIESVSALNQMGLSLVKIPSGEILNTPYLQKVSACFDRIILSTGMATLADVEFALDTLTSGGPKSITLLHCNTEYPTPYADVNLNAMETLRKAFGLPVGYSDHTQGIEIPIAAAALGAVVLEKHFTLDRSMVGPDHSSSLEPGELAAMVQAVRHTQQAMGTGIKRPSPSEARNMEAIRKSIVAARDIRIGELYCPENLDVKRPGSGLSPIHWNLVLGRRANRDYRKDEMIQL